MINCGAGVVNIGAVWGKTPKTVFTAYSSGNFLSKIKSQIDLNRPVLIHCKNNNGNQHWVVAYGYNNMAISNDNILVLDPAGSSNSKNGATRTLSESMNYNHKLTYINQLKLTSAK